MPQLEPLNLKLTGSADGLTAALGKAENRVGSFGSHISSIGTKFATVAAAINPISVAIAAGLAVITGGATLAAAAIARIGAQLQPIDDLADAAAKLGVRFNDLKGLRLAIGEATGMQGEQVDAAVAKFQLNLSEAASKQAGTVFDRLKSLGLNARELIAVGPIEAIAAISAKVQDLKSPTDQLRVAFELFGKSGVALANALREGPESFRETVKWAREALGLTDQQVAAVAKLNDKWNRINQLLDTFWQVIAGETAPAVETVLEQISEWSKRMGGVQQFAREVVDSYARAAGFIKDIIEAARGLDFNFDSAETFVAKLDESRMKKPPDRLKASESELAFFDEEEKKAAEWQRKADHWRETLRTPAEKLRDGIVELNDAVSKGGLDWESYARGVKSVTDEFVRAQEATSPRPLLSAVTDRAEQIRVIAERQQAKQDKDWQDKLLAETKAQVTKLEELIRVTKENGTEPPPIDLD